jgi:CHAD domain-containing protein
MTESYDLAPDDRADASVLAIVRHLFSAILANVDGVVADAGVEFVHDLRVADRRTRTALSQLKGVLPASVVDLLSPEFKWLGDVTGPCRDLDVFLLALNSERLRSEMADGVLSPLGNFLREKRRREHSLVCAALQSERFQRLVENWNRFLETGAEKETRPPLSSSPIFEVAGRRILEAFRRMSKRGTGIDIDPPAALLHRLRIDGKKLRYLLEFFSDLYPETTIERFLSELKQLQDILGGFNDTQVQLALIEEFKDQGTASAEALAATDRLAETITERQRGLRAEFAERFVLFTSGESRNLYQRTFKAG